MSQCYSLACMDCRESLWVAQRGTSGRLRLYGTDENNAEQAEFLDKHAGHRLSFDKSDEFWTMRDVSKDRDDA